MGDLGAGRIKAVACSSFCPSNWRTWVHFIQEPQDRQITKTQGPDMVREFDWRWRAAMQIAVMLPQEPGDADIVLGYAKELALMMERPALAPGDSQVLAFARATNLSCKS